MRLARWLLVLLLVLLAAPLGASDRVELHIAGAPSRRDAVDVVIRERLHPRQIAVETHAAEWIDVERALRRDAAAAPALARVYLILGDDGAELYLVDGGVERVLSRRVARSAAGEAGDELLREELGLIVLTAIETLQAGGAVGEARDDVRRRLGLNATVVPAPAPAPPPAPSSPPASPPAPPPQPPPAPPAPPAPALRLGGALFYEGQGYASEQVVVHGPALGLRLDLRRVWPSPGLAFEAHYRLPYEQRGDEAGFELQSLSLRLLAHAELVQTPMIALALHGGVAVDTLFIDPFLVIASRAVASDARARVSPLPRFGPSLRLRLFGDTSLALGFYLDVDAIGTRYVIQRGSELVPLVEPLRVRPSFRIGLETTLFGADMFAAEEAQ